MTEEGRNILKGFNNYIIYSNAEKDNGLALSKSLEAYIKKKGCKASVISENWFDTDIHIDEEILENAECMIVMGGDGTMLRASRAIGIHDISMIGVNLGTLGFLTEVDGKNIYRMADRLINGNFSIEKRMMLSGCVTRKESQTRICRDALNDIVVSRSGKLRVVAFKIYVNGQLLDTYEADGVIVSTPTGSTGYNLSAGGPIASPNAALILVTPVSPHALSAKSIIFSAEDTIRIEIIDKRSMDDFQSIASFDGNNLCDMAAGDFVEIRSSDNYINLVKMYDVNFYEVLRKKIGG